MLDDVLKWYYLATIDTDRNRALAVVHDALARGASPEVSRLEGTPCRS